MKLNRKHNQYIFGLLHEELNAFNLTYSERCRGLQGGGGGLSRLLTEHDERDVNQLEPLCPLFSLAMFN